MYQLQHRTGKIANVQHYTCALTVVSCFVIATELVLTQKNYLCCNNLVMGNLSYGSICPKLNGSNYPKVSL